MVAAAENDIGKRFSETLIKQITGGDEIIGRPLYKEHIQYRPAYKICLSTNHRPDISDTTHAMWRRMRLIPFDFVVPTSQKDKHLSDKLLKELPGILNWAIEGCLLWEEEGLEPPGEVVEATAAYREDMDVLANFLAQRCIVEAGANVAFSELYKEYVSWCTENGEQPISQRHFGGILTEKRFQKARERSASKRTIYRGIRLAKPPSTGGMNSLGRNGHDRNEI